MAYTLKTLDICGRHNDFLNNFLFTYDVEISDVLFFIDIKSTIGNVIKSYALGDGLSIYSPTQLLWSFGDLLELPSGNYTYALKSVENDKPSTDFGGTFTVKKEETKWKL